MLTLRALPVGGPPPGGLPAPCAGCGVREWRRNLCREGCPRPGPPLPAPLGWRGAAGGGGFRPSGPSPRPRGSSEKTQRDRSSIETKILLELNLGSGQACQPSCGSLQEFLQSTH